ELLKKHDEQYLRANIAIVEEQLKKKGIQNVPAYLLSALKTDFRPVQSAHTQSQEKEAQEKQHEQLLKDKEQLQMQQAKEQFESERKTAIESAMKRISENEQQALLTGFVLENEHNV